LLDPIDASPNLAEWQAEALRAREARDARTGRSADPGGAAHVSRLMHETYSDLGCATERLPALALGPRLDLLLARCGLPPAAGTKRVAAGTKRVAADTKRVAADTLRNGEARGIAALDAGAVSDPADDPARDAAADAAAEAEVARVAAAYGVVHRLHVPN
jgi:hypothetical protein